MTPVLTTRQKLFIAGLACKTVRIARAAVGRDMQVRVRRHGVDWELDLREGIDLSIYLLGAFERGTLQGIERLVRPGMTVLDIGANIGAHTLHLARLVGGNGRVIAVEPTQFAWKKLLRNIALNPRLAGQIEAQQALLVASDLDPIKPRLYSSWPVDGALLVTDSDLHVDHGGKAMSTTGASAVSLDRLLDSLGVTRVDFIKIDVDGHEPAVFDGGAAMLRRDRPDLLIEFAPFVYLDDMSRFEHMIRLLAGLDYQFIDIENHRKYPADAERICRMIPAGAGRNVHARSRSRGG
ncbi:MAG: FkbM family methyltransferase [Myxococcales bacterium]|nr:FkbM family methyltransferase [Myxococcales bacterium]